MKKRMTLAVVLTMMVSCCVWAQTKVIVYSPNIVRVVKGDAQQVEKKQSLVVTMAPQQTKKMAFKWTIDKEGRVTFMTNSGQVLTREGETAFTPITKGPDKGASKVKQTWTVEANEGIYGIGMLQNGKMSMRGEKRRMEQSNLDDYAHFFQSIKGYGVLWDNYSPTQIAVPEKDQAGELMLESEVGQIDDYYFIYGGDADGVIHHMRELTGKVPMQALWTYGFHQSRERYKSQNELLEVVRKYRELGIPFDGIIQDWQYWGSNYTWNAMDFLHEDFQQAQRMIDEVHKKGAHLSISVWASFGPHTKQFRELKEKGLLFSFETWPQSALPMWPPHMDYPSGVRVYNPYNQEARDIYWRYLSKMHKMGIDGWWLDSTDPDHCSYKDSDLDEMLKMDDRRWSGAEEQVSYRSVRNAFPLMTVGGVYDHQRADDQQKRPFILTRSFLAGQQRTGAMSWSGDIGSSWESLRKQIPLCLNHTLTANPNVNTDIGGFFCGGYNTRGGNSAMHNDEFRELYVRWMQFGAFNPMMRSHGADCWREIYYYGKKGEPVYDALVDAIKLRYRMLPTIYSQAWQVSKNDDSFMRALFMDFKNDEKTWDNGREFLFGHNILVCPVLEPFYTGEKKIVTDAMSGWNQNNNNGQEAKQKSGWETPQPVEVYLPAGTQWYNYWTGKCHDGGQQLQTTVALNQLPLFIKAGSILCEGPDVQYSNEKAWDKLDLTIYPGQNATFTLYEDEGDGFGYEKGQHSTITFTWNDKAKRLTIGARQGEYPGMLKERTFRVRLVDGLSKEVKYSGKELKLKIEN